MKICMPAEEWAEWMEWLDRLEFAQKMELLPGDRAFSANGQNWLHVWHRNVQLGMLRFVEEQKQIVGNSHYGQQLVVVKQMCMQKCTRRAGEPRLFGEEQQQQQYVNVPIAEVEMPGNITNFRSICISYLNPAVMHFLRLLCPLFSHVNLIIGSSAELVVVYGGDPPDKLADYETVLAHLLPMLTGPLESLVFTCYYPQLLRFIYNNFPAVLAGATLLDTNLDDDIGWTVQCLTDWLFSPLHQLEAGDPPSTPPPRKLILHNDDNDSYNAFMQGIRTRFLSAIRQKCCFFAKLICTRHEPESLLENGTLGEQMRVHSVAVTEPGFDVAVLISCWPIISNEEDNKKIAEEERKLLRWDVDNMDRSIYVWSPTIGQGIKAAAGSKADEEKPETSSCC